YLSFYRLSGYSNDKQFVGLSNYQKILSDEIYWHTFTNTMLLIFVGGIFVFLIGLAFTALMSQGIKGKTVVRAVIFFPQIIAPIALAIVWNYLYRYNGGLFNGVLNLVGLDSVNWTNPEHIIGSGIAAVIWYSLGFYAIILLSGVDKIPNDIFESARMEGASI